MQGYNLLVVFASDGNRVLMCRRKKEPYIGMSNFAGGKIEDDESGSDAAYRELFEETGITSDDITLRHMMDFTYYIHDCYVEVYVGRLKRDMRVTGDENRLYWSELSHNFFNLSLYAGEGNIGHIMEQVRQHEKELFADSEPQLI